MVSSGGQIATQTLTLSVRSAAVSTAATVTSVTPATGQIGATVPITIVGTNLSYATLSFPTGSGISISQVNISSDGTTITAVLAISTTASAGTRS